MTSFRQAARIEGGDGRFGFEASPDWTQGRTQFGGLLTAVGLQAASRELPDARPVRSVQARFCAPVDIGPVDIRVEQGVFGRSVGHRRAVLSQGGRTCTIVDVTFGATRDASRIRIAGPPMPEGPAPGEGLPFPYIDGVTPVFTREMEATFTDGPLPFSGADEALVGGWCRWRDDEGSLGGLVALLDSWPPPTLPTSTVPHPSSTIHLTVHLTGNRAEAGDWLRFQGRALTAGEGYITSQGFLWAPDGRLLAWMEQLYASYDK